MVLTMSRPFKHPRNWNSLFPQGRSRRHAGPCRQAGGPHLAQDEGPTRGRRASPRGRNEGGRRLGGAAGGAEAADAEAGVRSGGSLVSLVRSDLRRRTRPRPWRMAHVIVIVTPGRFSSRANAAQSGSARRRWPCVTPAARTAEFPEPCRNLERWPGSNRNPRPDCVGSRTLIRRHSPSKDGRLSTPYRATFSREREKGATPPRCASPPSAPAPASRYAPV